jgi:hypothetical protein
MMFVPHRKHGPPRCVTEIALLLYVDDVCTSEETNVWTSMVCYGESFTFVYVDNVRTSQEAWTTTVRYGG